MGSLVDRLTPLGFALLVSACTAISPTTSPTETPSPPSSAPPTSLPATPGAPSATPTPSSVQTEASGPTRIAFASGETSATISGTLRVGETQHYVVYAFAGQIMRVYLEPLGAVLTFSGEDGTLLHGPDDPHPFWRGRLPSTQNYRIDIAHSSTGIGPTDAPFQLSVVIVPRGQTTEQLTYTDQAHGFALSYSDTFAEGQPPPIFENADEPPLLGLIFTGSEYFHETNLNEVALIVSERPADPTEQACGLPIAPGGVVSSDEVTVNGLTYHRVEYRDAAAGNLYDLIVHSVKHDGNCYAISFYLHSGNIDNYPPGIAEFDREAILGQLRDVLSTFHFLDGS